MARRAAAFDAMLGARGIDQALVYGADRSGSAVQWLCEWPVTREAALWWRPGGEHRLFVQFHNHVPNARRFATAVKVDWGGPSTLATVAGACATHGALRRLGVVGPLPASGVASLGVDRELVFLDGDNARLRAVKSPEELEWVRVGSALTDDAMRALSQHASPGMTEAELCALVEHAYLGRGGMNHIHYFGVTSMRAPRVAVPAQWPSMRRVRVGVVVVCEISASWWGYPGQPLRSFSVGEDPTPEYRGCTTSPSRSSTRSLMQRARGRRPASSRRSPRPSRPPAVRRSTTSCTALSAATSRR